MNIDTLDFSLEIKHQSEPVISLDTSDCLFVKLGINDTWIEYRDGQWTITTSHNVKVVQTPILSPISHESR